MIVTHRDTPIAHAAARVSDGNSTERFFSLFILERMQPGDGAIELSLSLRVARDSEVDAAELFGRIMSMHVSFLCTGRVDLKEKGGG
jgi:hypothetical protein